MNKTTIALDVFITRTEVVEGAFIRNENWITWPEAKNAFEEIIEKCRVGHNPMGRCENDWDLGAWTRERLAFAFAF